MNSCRIFPNINSITYKYCTVNPVQSEWESFKVYNKFIYEMILIILLPIEVCTVPCISSLILSLNPSINICRCELALW